VKRRLAKLLSVSVLALSLGSGTASAASGDAVVSGTFAGKAQGAAAGVVVVAEKPTAEGQARTISVYVCNGSSLSAWLTGKTAGNVVDLKSADGQVGVHVALTALAASGKVGLLGGSGFSFRVFRTVRAGLFDVTVTATGLVRGTSTTGGKLTGHVGTSGKLPSQGTVTATVSGGGQDVNLTAFARHLTPGAYRWIVLTDGKVWGANRLGPIRGGIGGFVRPTGGSTTRIEAGSAGQKGYDDKKCGELANKWNNLVAIGARAVHRGDTLTAKTANAEADKTYGEMSDHCLVVEPS
jgi:hypothetical protein